MDNKLQQISVKLENFSSNSMTTHAKLLINNVFTELKSIIDKITVKFDTMNYLDENDAAVLLTNKIEYKIRISKELTIENRAFDKTRPVFYGGKVIKTKELLITYVICHELCHIIVDEKFNASGHGSIFCKELLKKTGLTSPYHALEVEMDNLNERSLNINSYIVGQSIYIYSTSDCKEFKGKIIDISFTYVTVRTKNYTFKVIREYIRPD